MESSRYKIKRFPDGVAVSARVVRDWEEIGFTTVFFTLAFSITCIAPFVLEEDYFADLHRTVVHFVITAWFVLLLLHCLLWQLFGRENISIRNGILSHGYTLFSVGRKRSFPLRELSDWQFHTNIPKAPVARGRNPMYPDASYYKDQIKDDIKRPRSDIPNVLRIQKCKQGAWSFDYQGVTVLIGAFFDSRDCQSVHAELDRFIPLSAKSRPL